MTDSDSKASPLPQPFSAPIALVIDGAVATVRLNRPERLNALDLPMWAALGDVFEALAAQLAPEGPVRAVVVRGAGGKAFAAGADINEFDTVRATPEQAQAYDEIMRRALTLVAACPVPVVAAIEGACVGGGLELACLCDLRLSNASGRFGVPINRIGVVMAYPEIQAIMRLAGPANTLSLLLEGRIIDAPDALRMGLLNRVVEDDAFEAHLNDTLKGLTQGAPGVNAWHKAFVRRLRDGAPVDAAEMAECYRFLETEDYREGIAAFKDKRKPRFTGR
ncbi:enoyl-CoA hydratase-related protein [Pararhodospirillum oryzae]|uniref:Enoyl-CoA hydratase n=1 Tax=Pararhodospirillum oryzae TaxID=478448 RepID=A0A512H8M9_9PROT|nr:enoyl-CoA hydratase-related protein [Pararhodospirillum oryzae]GEO81807.1 enoyl-CoA hydratase [Pararhodospirillum oryzae]